MFDLLNQRIPTTRLFANEPMMNHTTFRVGGPADVYALPENADELQWIIARCRIHGAPFTLLGRGANVLVADEGVRGVVIQLYPHFCHCYVSENRLIAEAGVSLSALANTACDHHLAGLAFASGIPGTVGGAVFMNAGAYDHDIAGVCQSVTLLTETGAVVTVAASDMGFGYRQSAVQHNGGIVLSAVFALTPGDAASIRAEMDDLNARRKQTQPLEYPSAGSTFKRPPGHYAGRLIADCGLKGYAVGGACVSEKHAGFVVNKGGATADDILRVVAHVQETVFARFGVTLEPEIRYIGR